MKYIFLVVLIVSFINSHAQKRAKRGAPKEVKPVVANGMKFYAPTNKMGFIVAREAVTDSMLWEKQIYKIVYLKNLEEDVQSRFIDSIWLDRNFLIIRREDNKLYDLNLNFITRVGSDSDRKLLQQMEYNWLMAEFRLDTAFISDMMDENFVAVGIRGLSNKHQELRGIHADMTARRKSNHIVDSLYLDDMQIQFYDNTAIVTFFSVTKGHVNNIPFSNRRTRMYDVWIKRDGKWKAVSSQVTPVRY